MKYTSEYLAFEKEFTSSAIYKFDSCDLGTTAKEAWRLLVLQRRDEAMFLWESAGGDVYINEDFIDTCCCKCRCNN